MTDMIDPNCRPNRRHVIHVINGEFYSGAERVQDLLGHRLPEFGFDVTFACVKPGQFATHRHFVDARVIPLPMRRRVDMRPVRRLVTIARQTNAVLLHAHTPRSLMVARMASAVTSIPVIYHVHSPTSRDSTQPLRNWLNNKVERFSLRGVARLIAVSKSLDAHMQAEGISPARIAVVPNGVPAADPPPAPRPTPSTPWTIGTVALFRPRKGLESLLQALSVLIARGHGVQLRGIGAFESAEYEGQILQLVNELGIHAHVQWAGFRRDITAELGKLDLFVLPSLFGEGLPMVILEAMAAGCPVVATRVQGVPEAIRERVDGVLANPDDPDDLARAIESVITGTVNWQHLRAAAIKRHRRCFSDRRMAEQVAAVYNDVLGTPQEVRDHNMAATAE